MENDNVEWVKWAIELWVPVSMGWVPVSLGLFIHLYKRMDAIQKDTQKLVNKAADRIEAKQEAFRSVYEEDRRQAYLDRQSIAEKMVTREELERQVDRIIRGIKPSA